MIDHAEFIERLRKARKLIEGGWVQGTSQAGNSYCLASALYTAGLCWRNDYKFVGDDKHDYPIGWNDAPGRTQAEVLACIDNSIAALEASPEGRDHK